MHRRRRGILRRRGLLGQWRRLWRRCGGATGGLLLEAVVALRRSRRGWPWRRQRGTDLGPSGARCRSWGRGRSVVVRLELVRQQRCGRPLTVQEVGEGPGLRVLGLREVEDGWSLDRAGRWWTAPFRLRQ